MKSDTDLYAELFQRNMKLSSDPAAVCDRLEIVVTSFLSLCQASPDVDEEGFSLRPGDEGDNILLVKRSSNGSSLGTLLLQTIIAVWLSDTLDEFPSSLDNPNQ